VGKPEIAGTRITVEWILEKPAAGETPLSSRPMSPSWRTLQRAASRLPVCGSVPDISTRFVHPHRRHISPTRPPGQPLNSSRRCIRRTPGEVLNALCLIPLSRRDRPRPRREPQDAVQQPERPRRRQPRDGGPPLDCLRHHRGKLAQPAASVRSLARGESTEALARFSGRIGHHH
jgi:hypothetical protein